MIRYRGKYRTVYEVDKSSGQPYEFAFIPCLIKKGANICRHSDNMLNAYIPSTKIANRLLKEYPDVFTPLQVGDKEATLLFRESDIEKAATILKARVMGKNKSPKPKRRIVISEERKQALSDRMKQIHVNSKIIGENARKTG